MDEQTPTAVVAQGPMTGGDVVDAVEDAKAALDRKPEFNALRYEPTAPAGDVKSLGLPQSLTTPDPLAAPDTAGSASKVPVTTTSIKELLPALDTASSEQPAETTYSSAPQ